MKKILAKIFLNTDINNLLEKKITTITNNYNNFEILDSSDYTEYSILDHITRNDDIFINIKIDDTISDIISTDKDLVIFYNNKYIDIENEQVEYINKDTIFTNTNANLSLYIVFKDIDKDRLYNYINDILNSVIKHYNLESISDQLSKYYIVKNNNQILLKTYSIDSAITLSDKKIGSVVYDNTNVEIYRSNKMKTFIDNSNINIRYTDIEPWRF